jgi:ribosomal protein L37AE/L43A
MASKWWLLLEKSDETRVSQGIDAYRDETGRAYHYDSLVPNHRNLSPGDSVVIRKENEILGTGLITDISVTEGTKTHRRCPTCGGTDVRERVTLIPKWKCGKCAAEFAAPTETTTNVRSFVAAIQGFQGLSRPPTVQQVKACAVGGNGGKSQLSMIELDPDRLAAALGGSLPENATLAALGRTINKLGGQGFGLSAEQRRAVELRAMSVVEDMYIAEGWAMKDTSATQPFDFLATRGNQKRYIEVKGTSGLGESVMLTHSEVDHAHKYPADTALVVVVGIVLTQAAGKWRGDGGRISNRLDPWTPEPERLFATEYRYSVPGGSACTV